MAFLDTSRLGEDVCAARGPDHNHWRQATHKCQLPRTEARLAHTMEIIETLPFKNVTTTSLPTLMTLGPPLYNFPVMENDRDLQ